MEIHWSTYKKNDILLGTGFKIFRKKNNSFKLYTEKEEADAGILTH